MWQGHVWKHYDYDDKGSVWQSRIVVWLHHWCWTITWTDYFNQSNSRIHTWRRHRQKPWRDARPLPGAQRGDVTTDWLGGVTSDVSKENADAGVVRASLTSRAGREPASRGTVPGLEVKRGQHLVGVLVVQRHRQHIHVSVQRATRALDLHDPRDRWEWSGPESCTGECDQKGHAGSTFNIITGQCLILWPDNTGHDQAMLTVSVNSYSWIHFKRLKQAKDKGHLETSWDRLRCQWADWKTKKSEDRETIIATRLTRRVCVCGGIVVVVCVCAILYLKTTKNLCVYIHWVPLTVFISASQELVCSCVPLALSLSVLLNLLFCTINMLVSPPSHNDHESLAFEVPCHMCVCLSVCGDEKKEKVWLFFVTVCACAHACFFFSWSGITRRKRVKDTILLEILGMELLWSFLHSRMMSPREELLESKGIHRTELSLNMAGVRSFATEDLRGPRQYCLLRNLLKSQRDGGG